MVAMVTPGVGLLLAAACQLTVDLTYGQNPEENISFTDGATSDSVHTFRSLSGDQENDVTNSTPLSNIGSPEVGEGGPQPLSDFSKALISVFYAIVTVVAVGGNAIVCCIVATQRRMQTVTNFFIVSLACSDVLIASLCIPMTFVANVITHYWPFGVALCPIVLYAQVSVILLVCVLSTSGAIVCQTTTIPFISNKIYDIGQYYSSVSRVVVVNNIIHYPTKVMKVISLPWGGG